MAGMTDYRASFDAEIRFSNGGDLSAHGFRVDLPSPDAGEAEIAALFVASLGLLMTDTNFATWPSRILDEAEAAISEIHPGQQLAVHADRERRTHARSITTSAVRVARVMDRLAARVTSPVTAVLDLVGGSDRLVDRPEDPNRS